MVKRTASAALLLFFCTLLVSGCYTAGRSLQGAAQGATEDASMLAGGITKLDNWIRANLW